MWFAFFAPLTITSFHGLTGTWVFVLGMCFLCGQLVIFYPQKGRKTPSKVVICAKKLIFCIISFVLSIFMLIFIKAYLLFSSHVRLLAFGCGTENPSGKALSGGRCGFFSIKKSVTIYMESKDYCIFAQILRALYRAVIPTFGKLHASSSPLGRACREK